MMKSISPPVSSPNRAGMQRSEVEQIVQRLRDRFTQLHDGKRVDSQSMATGLPTRPVKPPVR